MYLYGASGHAKVIIDILENNRIPIDGLYDDHSELTELCGYPVSRPVVLNSPLIISIGDNKIRKRLSETLPVDFGTAIDPSAIISHRSEYGMGTVMMQGVIVQSHVHIGEHCIINSGSSIDHDCTIGNYVHISPHTTLCGNISVGEGSWIGAGTTVIPGVSIGRWCVIGAGSVVTKDIPDYSLAVGNRCKIVKTLK